MLPTSTYRNQTLELLAMEFPGAEGLEIDHFNLRMQPISYHNGFRMKDEYPPTLRWRVGGKVFSYAPRPRFQRIVIKGMWPLISDKTGEEPVYGDRELDAVRHAIRSSIEAPAHDRP